MSLSARAEPTKNTESVACSFLPSRKSSLDNPFSVLPSEHIEVEVMNEDFVYSRGPTNPTDHIVPSGVSQAVSTIEAGFSRLLTPLSPSRPAHDFNADGFEIIETPVGHNSVLSSALISPSTPRHINPPIVLQNSLNHPRSQPESIRQSSLYRSADNETQSLQAPPLSNRVRFDYNQFFNSSGSGAEIAPAKKNEEDDDASTLDFEHESLVQSSQDRTLQSTIHDAPQPAMYIPDTEEDEDQASEDGTPDIEVQEPRAIISLLDDDDSPQSLQSEQSDRVIAAPLKIRKDNNQTVNCGVGRTVEFVNKTFMRIHKVVKDSADQVYLIGQHFIRQNSFGPKVPKRRNEVIWISDQNSGGDGLQRRLLRKDLVVRNRKLILTNITYPTSIDDKDHPRRHPDSCRDPLQDVEIGPLFCRMKRCKVEQKDRIVEEMWVALTEDEADPDYKVNRNHSRNVWRGLTVSGGSHIESHPLYDTSSPQSLDRYVIQKYTFGDAFCGAGGTSCGARIAGLHNSWAFDYEMRAVQTYRLNFRETDCRNQAVDEFIADARSQNFRVDIMHMSPPCQPFSDAHTIPCPEKDEANQAALLSVGALLGVIKPRIVTLEQTRGLKSRHEAWLWAILHDFITAGYSLHWKIMACSDYGVPQLRKRLVIIGAGPGETLPAFPEPTHSTDPRSSLIPVDTIRKVLAKIQPNTPNNEVTYLYETPLPPIDPNQLAKTITTNGGVGNRHPSGKRPYTVREFACFQTFPITFKLAKVGITAQKRQIGNAVPPIMAATVYKAIIKSLRETDAA